MKINLIFLLIFVPFITFAHEINIEDKKVEEIVKQRMNNMSKIKAYSTKMYPLVMSGKFEEIKQVNNELLHAAKDFKLLFPEGSQGGKASSLIWEDTEWNSKDKPKLGGNTPKETFSIFNDNFIKDIENINESIESKDNESVIENFNIMLSNCGTCHKKFRK
jgi:cytochrome c556